jgi:hypothetical protein
MLHALSRGGLRDVALIFGAVVGVMLLAAAISAFFILALEIGGLERRPLVGHDCQPSHIVAGIPR